jgi:hypothetical protein
MSFGPPPPHDNELARVEQQARSRQAARSARRAQLEADGELPPRQSVLGRLMRRVSRALGRSRPDSTDSSA